VPRPICVYSFRTSEGNSRIRMPAANLVWVVSREEVLRSLRKADCRERQVEPHAGTNLIYPRQVTWRFTSIRSGSAMQVVTQFGLPCELPDKSDRPFAAAK
jgi:hypothetical protein